MKTITAFECDFCKKLYRSKSGIGNHEKRCFHNPETKSCISCKFLGSAGKCNGSILTELQESILRYEVEGTYHLEKSNDPEFGADFNFLNNEYQYLYNAEQVTFCNSLKIELPKLRTNCGSHKSQS